MTVATALAVGLTGVTGTIVEVEADVRVCRACTWEASAILPWPKHANECAPRQ